MENIEQFAVRCKALGFNIKDFDYIKPKKNKKEEHISQFIIPGRRFYENSNLWSFIFEKSRIEDFVQFFLDKGLYKDMTILEKIASVPEDNNWDKIKSIIKKHFEDMIDEKEKSIDLDNLLYSVIVSGNFFRFKELVSMFSDKIKPLYGTFGNSANGDVLMEMVKNERFNRIKELVEVYKADPSINDNLCLMVAVKYENFCVAMYLVENGADYHTKNDICLKILNRSRKTISKHQQKYKNKFKSLFDE